MKCQPRFAATRIKEQLSSAKAAEIFMATTDLSEEEKSSAIEFAEDITECIELYESDEHAIDSLALAALLGGVPV